MNSVGGCTSRFSFGMKNLLRFSLFFAAALASPTMPGSAQVVSGKAEVLEANAALVTQLTGELRDKHPALLAARARTNAAAAGARSIRSWEDPHVRLGGMAAREEMRAEDGDLIYGVEQKLPLFGKSKLARQAAQSELATETAMAEYEFQVLRREVAKVVFRTALADEVVQIGQQDLSWLHTMTQTIEGKYRAGQATLVEVLQLQNEEAKRVTQLQTDQDKLLHERVTLNRLLNREQQSSWPRLALPAPAGPIVYSAKLADLALQYEPKVAVLRRQVAQAQATVEMTRRQQYPDVNVGLEARNYTGDGSFRQGMLVFSMNLPWVNHGKYRNEIQRDEAKLQASEYVLADYQLSVREEVHQLTVKIDAARREALLYRNEIIPRSESALETARFGWEANRNSFRDLVDARRMLLEGRLMQARAISEQYQTMAELVLCCGLGDMEALQMIGALPETEPEGKPNEK
jgi:outer membrane protein TolC